MNILKLHIEFLASLAVFCVNFACQEEKLSDRLISLKMPLRVVNATYETFISRAMISSCSKTELLEEIKDVNDKNLVFAEFLLKRLIGIVEKLSAFGYLKTSFVFK